MTAEYTRSELSGAAEPDSALAARLQRLNNLTVVPVSGMGSPNDMVVRFEVTLEGGPPPDGRTSRYFRMSHSLLTGWHMESQSNAVSYYLNIF